MESCKPAKIEKQIKETKLVYIPIFEKLYEYKEFKDNGIYLLKEIKKQIKILENQLMS